MDVLIWFGIAILGNLALVVYVAFWVMRTIDEIRAESRRAAEIAEKLRAEWDEFNRAQRSQIAEKLTEVEGRAKNLEEDTGSRLQEFENGVRDTRLELQRLERYLRDVFEVELKNVFDSFDHTTRSVLEEMRTQLLNGVERIDEIRNLVEGRDAVEGRLVEGRVAVQGLTEGAVDIDNPAEEERYEEPQDEEMGEREEEPKSEALIEGGETDAEEAEDNEESEGTVNEEDKEKDQGQFGMPSFDQEEGDSAEEDRGFESDEDEEKTAGESGEEDEDEDDEANRPFI